MDGVGQQIKYRRKEIQKQKTKKTPKKTLWQKQEIYYMGEIFAQKFALSAQMEMTLTGYTVHYTSGGCL